MSGQSQHPCMECPPAEGCDYYYEIMGKPNNFRKSCGMPMSMRRGIIPDRIIARQMMKEQEEGNGN